jgi:hypothetical protein
VTDLVDELAVLLLNQLQLFAVHEPIIAQDPALVKLDLEVFDPHGI